MENNRFFSSFSLSAFPFRLFTNWKHSNSIIQREVDTGFATLGVRFWDLCVSLSSAVMVLASSC